MYRFTLPDIGEGVVEAEVIAWKVCEGERIAADQVMVELMTDKANVEIPSPVAGVVTHLYFKEGDIAPVGAVLIEIDDGASAAAGAQAKPTPPAAAASTPQAKASAAPKPAAPAPRSEPRAHHPPAMPARPVATQRATVQADAGGVRAVPAVRELAKRLGVDLRGVHGSGPGGRIMRHDVEEALQAAPSVPSASHAPATSAAPREEIAPPAPRVAEPPAVVAETLLVRSEEAPRYVAAPEPPDWKRVPLRGVRRAIARHMSEARKRAAHFTYVEEVDLTRLLGERDRAAASGRVPKLSPLVFIARAVVRALPQHPQLNASLDDERGELVLKGKIHLGIAAATEDGLVVPVVHDAAGYSTLGLAEEIERLAGAGREGALTPHELRGGSFTISSLGKLGGIVSTPIVNYPEVAILGVGAAKRLPRYVGDALLPREIMNLSISVDHRVADGDHAARFVADLKQILEDADFSDVFGEPSGSRRSES